MPRLGPTLRRKAAPGGFSGGNYGGGPFYTDAYRSKRAPSPPELVEAYKGVVFSFAKINARAVASTPLRLYVTTRTGQSKPKGHVGARPINRWTKGWLKTRSYLTKALAGAEDVEEVTGEHPVLETLHRVNPFLDTNQLLSLTVISCDVIGEAYWEPTGGTLAGRRTFDELWMLPAQVIWPVPDGTSIVPKGYQYFSQFYEPDQLIRFREPGLRNPYMNGLSGTRAAIENARLEDEFLSVQDNLYSNGPRPGLVISPKDASVTFGDAERARTRQEFNAMGSRGRLGSVAIVDGVIDVHPIQYPTVDAAAVQLSQYNIERIANALDIPPPFYSKETNLANMQAAKAWHSENAVEPRCKSIASTLTRYFQQAGGAMGWDRLFFAFDPVVEEDKIALSNQHKTYWDMGVLTTNEVRADLNREPVENGDVITVASSLTTLDRVVNPPDPPAEAAPGKLGQNPAKGKSLDEPCGCGESMEGVIFPSAFVAEGKAYWQDDDGRKAFLDDLAAYVKKYKPCRDKRGRFTACGGAGGGGATAEKPQGEKPAPVPAFTSSPAATRPLSQAKVTMEGGKGFLDYAKTVFGRDVSAADLASVSGAPDDAKVKATRTPMGLRMEWKSPAGYAVRYARQEDGKPYIKNEYFEINKEHGGQGLGREAFARQVDHATRLGVTHLETDAARDAGRSGVQAWGGYYVWPRFGYDGPLDPRDVQKLPKPLKKARNVSDLMASEAGRDWWKENGHSIGVKFDLAPNSLSRRIWTSYNQAKANSRPS